jgi:hypothetical protein
MKKFAPLSHKTAYTLSTVLLLSFGASYLQSAHAQVNPDIVVGDNGEVRVQQNAFQLITGPQGNDSNIPQPAGSDF